MKERKFKGKRKKKRKKRERERESIENREKSAKKNMERIVWL